MSQRDPTSMSARSWLEEMRRMSGEPLLSRLRYVDRASAFDVRDTEALLGLVDDRDDTWWIGDGIVRGLGADDCAGVLAASEPTTRYPGPSSGARWGKSL